MTPKDTEVNARIDVYTSKKYQRYVAWYAQNAKIAKNNLLVAFGVVVICALCLVYFPGPMDEMSLFQYRFDPTDAVKLGLIASIVLALASMFTSFKQMRRCLGLLNRLQSEFSDFDNRRKAGADVDDKTGFNAFQERVEALMAASNPEVVTAIELDNAKKDKTP